MGGQWRGRVVALGLLVLAFVLERHADALVVGAGIVLVSSMSGRRALDPYERAVLAEARRRARREPQVRP